MSIIRLSAVAGIGALALVLSGCGGGEQATSGVETLRLATLGSVKPSQQAFIDRMNELSEGSLTLDVSENWQPAGGGDASEEALATAVAAGDVDIAWVGVRALGAIGVTGLDSLEAPLLVRSHDQQRAVALGVPGEIITTSLSKTKVEGLALLPGPEQYPVAAGAPIGTAADWAGKTVQVSGQNPLEAETVTALGGTPAEGAGSIADLVAGSIQATTADPSQLVAGGAGKDGPYLTSNVALWPRMDIVLINRDVLNRLSGRQHGFLEGSVVRAQDVAMTEPDVATVITDACAAGVKFATATADQLTELTEAVQPVYDKLAGNAKDAKLLEAIQDVVKKNAGTGAFAVPKNCRYTAPK
ncbi:MAG: TRAP transporter substrate-binding protein [Pseudolysinimonas sp.]